MNRNILFVLTLAACVFAASAQGRKTGSDYDEQFIKQVKGNILVYSYMTGLPVDTLLTPDDLDGLKYNDFSVGSGNRYIMLATEKESIYRHSSKSFFYVYDRQEKKLTPLADKAKGKQREATFSPDGKSVAFVRDNNLFVTDLFSWKERQISFDGRKGEILNGIPDWVYEEEYSFSRAFEWSPESDAIAFWRFDEREVNTYSMTVMNQDLYPEVVSFKYPKAGEKNSSVQIKVCNLNIAGKTINIPLPEGDIYVPRITWTKADNKLAIHVMNRKQNDYKILLADALLGVSSTIYEETDPCYIEQIDDQKVFFLPDSRNFIVKNETDGWMHLYMYNYQGRKVSQITSGEWEIIDVVGIDPIYRKIYYTSTEESELQSQLYSISFNGKDKKRLTTEKGTHSITMSPSCMFYQDKYSSVSVPARTVLYDNTGKEIRVISDNTREVERDNANTRKPRKEFFTFTTSEGVELNGYMLYPHDFDQNKVYPILMVQYSGPGSQQVSDSYAKPDWYYELLDKGYIVGCVDGRGTGRRGAEFRKITYGSLGQYELKDQVEAAKYFGSLPYIDKDRIGIYGWSFGGFMAMNAILKAPDVFAVAIAVAPVISWRFYDSVYTERYNGLPQENPEGYDENSPLGYAAGLKGKLLLVHGTADDNVHIQNSYRMIEELVKAGKDYTLLVYPDKNHGMGSSRNHLYKQMSSFIEENL